MKSSNSLARVTSDDIQLYAKRWWILGCIRMQYYLFALSVHYFGSVNNVLRDYFGITYAMVDWFSISSIPASGLFCGVWTFLSLTKAQQFRRMSIISTGFALMGCLCSLISFIWRRLYVFVYIGSIFNGVLSSSGLRNVQSVQMHRAPPLLGGPPLDLPRAEKI